MDNTPDRFIAAAFREWACAVGIEVIGYEASQWIEQRAAELARDSVEDTAVPPKRLPDDGNGDEYNAGFNECRELWLTAWNTRTPAATVVGEEVTDAMCLDWLGDNPTMFCQCAGQWVVARGCEWRNAPTLREAIRKLLTETAPPSPEPLLSGEAEGLSNGCVPAAGEG